MTSLIGTLAEWFPQNLNFEWDLNSMLFTLSKNQSGLVPVLSWDTLKRNNEHRVTQSEARYVNDVIMVHNSKLTLEIPKGGQFHSLGVFKFSSEPAVIFPRKIRLT